MTQRWGERVACDVLCVDGLMACVDIHSSEYCKTPTKKVPDGDIQSGSEWENMPHTDRLILIDGFSYFKKKWAKVTPS